MIGADVHTDSDASGVGYSYETEAESPSSEVLRLRSRTHGGPGGPKSRGRPMTLAAVFFWYLRSGGPGVLSSLSAT